MKGTAIMAIIQSILALGNVKGAAPAAAVQALEPALCHIMTAGNRRNIDDTCAALRDAGAVAKSGEYAANVKGDILRALIEAAESALKAQAEVRPDGMKGRATSQEQDKARDMAEELCKGFLEAVKQAAEARKGSRKAPAAKPVKGSATGEGEGEGEGEGSARASRAPVGEDPGTLRAIISSLSDERDALADALAAMTQARDALAAQLAAMMASKPATRVKKPAHAHEEGVALAA